MPFSVERHKVGGASTDKYGLSTTLRLHRDVAQPNQYAINLIRNEEV
jgi:hypothetical protein